MARSYLIATVLQNNWIEKKYFDPIQMFLNQSKINLEPEKDGTIVKCDFVGPVQKVLVFYKTILDLFKIILNIKKGPGINLLQCF